MSRIADPPALILGGGITGLGALRNLGRRGIEAYVVGRAPAPYLRASRWYRHAPEINRGPVSPTALPAFLEALPFERAVPIPCADDWQLAVSGLWPTMRARFPTSGPSLDATRVLLDKGCLAQIVGQLGIPHPRTIPLSSSEALPALEDSFYRGVLLKPRDSKRFRRRFGVKGFRCRDRDEAEARFAEIRGTNLDMLLQEYVPGPPTAHYFIDGFIDRDGRTCARFARQRLRMEPPDLGNSTLMASVPLSVVEPAAKALDHLLGVLGYRGTFSAEFKRDERDGLFKIIEVNCRQWWYVGFAANCGMDMTWMTYQDALGRPVPTIERYPVGVRCVHPHYDRYACSRLRRAGQLSLWSWAASWIGARQPILCWDDPASALASLGDRIRHVEHRGVAALPLLALTSPWPISLS